MARQEQDREDLLRDGRNMPLRGRCWIEATEVLVGFRAQGQLSLYVGPDPVFQFNSERELRRAYVDGQRYAADRGSLARLGAVTAGTRLAFQSAPLEQDVWLAMAGQIESWLDRVRAAVRHFDWQTVGGEQDLFLNQLEEWLDRCPRPIKTAETPNA